MKTITVHNDRGSDLRFRGKLLAKATSHREDRRRWTELELYQVDGGGYVGSQVGRTLVDGEVDRYTAQQLPTREAVLQFFGHGPLAKDLYDDADIEDVKTIGGAA